MSKASEIKALLNLGKVMTDTKIAKRVGCHPTYVYQIRKAEGIPAHKAKLGRPRKTTVINASSVVSMIDATKAIHNTVKSIKDFGISFDYAREDFDVIWHDEVYQVAPSELEKTIDCIKFLASKEIQYFSFEDCEHDNA